MSSAWCTGRKEDNNVTTCRWHKSAVLKFEFVCFKINAMDLRVS